MSSQPIRLTPQGYEKLKQELQYLRSVKRKEIIAAVATAREKGDLRENAEYDAAKEAQALLEKRIGELSDKLASVQIIDENRMDASKAFIGATVELKDLSRDEAIRYVLVAKEEADLKTGRISVVSPVGQALLGKSVGDVVEVTIPAGKLKYRIEKISRGE